MRDLGKILTKRCFHHPIFVIGVGRSGTTALLGSIGKHPQILQMPIEAPFIFRISYIPYLYEFGENRDYLLRCLNVTKEYFYASLRRLCFETSGGKHYGLNALIRSLARGDKFILNKHYWCAKTYPDCQASQGLLSLYPQAKFIYIIRNGCDVVQSRTRFQGFSHLPFSAHCREWAGSIERYRYVSVLKSAMQVRHEELVSQPEIVLQEVFAFIGVKYHSAPVNFLRKTLIHPLNEPTHRDVDVKNILNTREPSYKNWSSEQRAQFKEIFSWRDSTWLPFSELGVL